MAGRAAPPSALRLRLYSAAVGIPLVLGAIWLGVPYVAAIVSLAAVVAMFEFHRMTVRAGTTPIFFLGVTGVVLLIVERIVEWSFLGPLVTGIILMPLYTLLLSPPRERFIADWAWTLVGVFLIGWTLSYAILLRELVQGREWLFSAVVLVFAVDTGSYFVGRAIGRHRMAPTISPGKTWEGALGGLGLGIVAAVSTAAGFDLDISAGAAVLLGVFVALFAQAGDLAVSMLKRTAGVKDTGGLIPGHGGVLDRLDSLIPALVVVYFFVTEGLGAL